MPHASAEVTAETAFESVPSRRADVDLGGICIVPAATVRGFIHQAMLLEVVCCSASPQAARFKGRRWTKSAKSIVEELPALRHRHRHQFLMWLEILGDRVEVSRSER